MRAAVLWLALGGDVAKDRSEGGSWRRSIIVLEAKMETDLRTCMRTGKPEAVCQPEIHEPNPQPERCDAPDGCVTQAECFQ